MLLTLSGCVSQTEDTGTRTITYEPALPPSLFLGAHRGLFRLENSQGESLRRYSVSYLLDPCFVDGAILLPDARNDLGRWIRSNRWVLGRQNDHYSTYRRRSGEDVRLNIGNNVTDQAGLEIVARLKARGIHPEKAPPQEVRASAITSPPSEARQ